MIYGVYEINRITKHNLHFQRAARRQNMHLLVVDRHVGASYISLALIFLQKSELAHAAAPPFSQKGTLSLPARL